MSHPVLDKLKHEAHLAIQRSARERRKQLEDFQRLYEAEQMSMKDWRAWRHMFDLRPSLAPQVVSRSDFGDLLKLCPETPANAAVRRPLVEGLRAVETTEYHLQSCDVLRVMGADVPAGTRPGDPQPPAKLHEDEDFDPDFFANVEQAAGDIATSGGEDVEPVSFDTREPDATTETVETA